jgi:hypothetical protein
MKRFLFLLAGLTLVAGTGNFTARAIDADPAKKYEVTPSTGLWMICAASYTGDNAGDKANDMVLDIRRNFNLPAYVFNHGAEERRKQQEEIDRIRKLCPGGRVRVHRVEEQFAVLVGGYKDMESARKALDGFKKLKPTNPKLVEYFDRQREAEKDGKKGIMTETVVVNPFTNSFVVRNPSVPLEQVQQDDGEDLKLLRKWNEDEPYSIFKCRKPWTLAVAVFQTPGAIQSQNMKSSSFLDKLFGDSAGERLNAGALNAHNLAELLRTQKKLEAYVFHTRNNSDVCIGSYDRRYDPQL